jgi:hypothetical protein
MSPATIRAVTPATGKATNVANQRAQRFVSNLRLRMLPISSIPGTNRVLAADVTIRDGHDGVLTRHARQRQRPRRPHAEGVSAASAPGIRVRP